MLWLSMSKLMCRHCRSYYTCAEWQLLTQVIKHHCWKGTKQQVVGKENDWQIVKVETEDTTISVKLSPCSSQLSSGSMALSFEYIFGCFFSLVQYDIVLHVAYSRSTSIYLWLLKNRDSLLLALRSPVLFSAGQVPQVIDVFWLLLVSWHETHHMLSRQNYVISMTCLSFNAHISSIVNM